jgi:hypothetical protein
MNRHSTLDDICTTLDTLILELQARSVARLGLRQLSDTETNQTQTSSEPK